MEMDCCEGCCFGWILKQVEKELNFNIKYSVRGWDFAKTAVLRVLKRCHDYPVWVQEDDDSEDVSPCGRNSFHHFWKIFTFLTNSFEALKLRDMDIAAKLLLCAYDLLLFRQNTEIHIYEFSWMHLQNCSKKVTENDFKLLMKVTYTDKVRHVLTRVVWTIVKNGNVFFLRNLLRYGVMCLPPRSVCGSQRKQFSEALQHLTFPDDNVYSSPSCDIWQGRINRRTLHVLRVVELLSLELKEMQTEPRGVTWDLLQPALRFHGISFDPESPRFKCLRMVFNSIPEPFVTSEELRGVLELAHADRCDSQSKMLMDALESGFKMMNPESEGFVTPRSLQHLSRCQLRDNLRQTGALPHGIHELELPSYIQAYVLLEQ